MLDMLKRHEIQVLRRAGHNATEIARLTGVSRRSVRRVEAEAPVEQIDKRVEIKKRRLGRPSRAEPFRLFVVDLLESEPELLSLEVFRRAKLAGYAGRKSALYELIRSVRQKKPKPMVRFEGLPGEFTQHDFGQVDVRFIDGTKKRIHFFASRPCEAGAQRGRRACHDSSGEAREHRSLQIAGYLTYTSSFSRRRRLGESKRESNCSWLVTKP